MLDGEDLLARFDKDVGRFMRSATVQNWRTREVRDSYALIDGDVRDQWTQDDLKRRKRKPVRSINRSAPILRAIAGYEIQNRSKIDYYPRIFEPAQQTQADVMDDAVEYIQEKSNFAAVSVHASEDNYRCGLGGTVTHIDYNDARNPDGNIVVERIFPGLLIWDWRCKNRNLIGSRYAGYIEPVDAEWLQDQINALGDKPAFRPDLVADATILNAIYSNDIDMSEVGFVYHYQWQEEETYYLVTNPFHEEAVLHDDYMMQLAALLEQMFELDMSLRVFSMSRKDYRAFKQQINAFLELPRHDGETMRDLEVEAEKSTRYRYYKNRIASGYVLDKTKEVFVPGGFSINFKTGYYDEVNGYWYGMARGMKEPQRLHNIAVSDYDSYLSSVPKGGMFATPKALGQNVKGFVKDQNNEEDVTVVNDLDGIREKTIPAEPGGLSAFIDYTGQMIPASIGLPVDFLGENMSGNMTDSLLARRQKQMMKVLAHYDESNRVYMLYQGEIFEAGVRVMAENNSGRMLRRISAAAKPMPAPPTPLPDPRDDYIRLTGDALAAEYDIRVELKPMSDDEKADMFQNLLSLAGTLLNKPNPVDITSLVIPYADIPSEDRAQVLALMAPPPPQPPDPLQQATVQANVDLLKAQAAEKNANAKNKDLDSLKLTQELATFKEQVMAEINNTVSSTILNFFKAGDIVTPKQAVIDPAGNQPTQETV